MSLMVIDPYRFGSGSGTSISLSFTDSDSSATNATEYTFSGLDIGAASATRVVVVCVSGHDVGGTFLSVSSLTIAGSAATSVVESAAFNTIAAIFRRTVTTGTTADVVVTFSEAIRGAHVSVYVLDNLASATPTDTASDNNEHPPSTTIDISAGGVAIAVAAQTATGATTTWTNLVEDYDAQTAVDGDVMSSASDAFEAAQTGLAITATFSSANSNAAICVASWL